MLGKTEQASLDRFPLSYRNLSCTAIWIDFVSKFKKNNQCCIDDRL